MEFEGPVGKWGRGPQWGTEASESLESNLTCDIILMSPSWSQSNEWAKENVEGLFFEIGQDGEQSLKNVGGD